MTKIILALVSTLLLVEVDALSAMAFSQCNTQIQVDFTSNDWVRTVDLGGDHRIPTGRTAYQLVSPAQKNTNWHDGNSLLPQTNELTTITTMRLIILGMGMLIVVCVMLIVNERYHDI